MNRPLDRLYELLPVVYRLRDYDQGEPLHALLQVIAEQVNVVEEDIRQLYENWFIETCQDWVVPYIGDLVGYRPVHEAGEPGQAAAPQTSALNKILIPRREVANTVRYRRRRGTLALLEELAWSVAGWPARAVEFYALLAWSQALNYLHLERGRTVDLHDGDALDRLDGPFDSLAHSVDVRHIGSRYAPQGRHNIPSVGLFVWRLRSYSVTKTQARCVEKVGPHCYTFSALGNNTPLYVRPEREPSPEHIAGELNVPAPIRPRAFEEYVIVNGKRRSWAASAYYSQDEQVRKSVTIWAPDWPTKGAPQPIPGTAVIPADLSGWEYRPRKGYIAVDPRLGRIVFPPGQLPKKGVLVSYQYGFSADMGGGEYERPLPQPANVTVYRVGGDGLPTINAALAQWTSQNPKPTDAVIEIGESGVFVERLGVPDPESPAQIRPIQLAAGQSLQLRAANGARPILRLLDYQTAGLDSLTILLGPGSRFTLDGLLIEGRGVHVENAPSDQPGDTELINPCDARQMAYRPRAQVHIRHCTLLPGWSLENDCEPKRPAEPSLELWNVNAQVTIERSILGSIQVYQDEVTTDPIPILLSDSILDATGTDCAGPECEALGAPDSALAHAVLTILRCTVFGKVMTHAMALAENTIFVSLVTVARSQVGCVRFCYVRPGSHTPRRYNCQPDLVEKLVQGEIAEAEIDRVLASERLRVRPQFNSKRYGTPAYCQLAANCAEEIVRGADDESEMGAFHDLYQPQRAANLRARLEEYVPAGMDTGIIYAS